MKNFNKINDIKNEISNGNVLLKFSAEWCGPCRILTNIIEDVENDFNSIKFIEVDIDDIDDDTILEEYKIRNIPTLFYIKDGLIIGKTVGALNKESLVNELSKF